jgi:hypothetical protein
VCDALDLTCAATQVAASAFDSIVASAGKAAAEMIGNAMTFWVGTETVNPDSPAVQNLQRYTVPVSAVILTGSVMVQGIRMMFSRKKEPLVSAAVDLIRYAVVSAIGLTTLALGVQAADAMAQSLIDQGINDYAERMKVVFGQGIVTGGGAFELLLLALIGFLLGILQWLLAFFRTAGLLVLAAMLTLAATRAEWMKRILPWALTLVAYKPMAAMGLAATATSESPPKTQARLNTPSVAIWLRLRRPTMIMRAQMRTPATPPTRAPHTNHPRMRLLAFSKPGGACGAGCGMASRTSAAMAVRCIVISLESGFLRRGGPVSALRGGSPGSASRVGRRGRSLPRWSR